MADIERVFISYARRDQVLVFRFIGDLASQGIGAWIDQRDINPGENWDNAIDQALDQYRYMIVMLSPHSAESPYVKREIVHSINRGDNLFVALIADCEIPLILDHTPRIDFRENYNKAVIEMAHAIKAAGYPVQFPIGSPEEIENNSTEHPPGKYDMPMWIAAHAFRVIQLHLPPTLRSSLTIDNLIMITQLEIDYFSDDQFPEPEQSLTDYIREGAWEQGLELSDYFIDQVLEANEIYNRLIGIIQD